MDTAYVSGISALAGSAIGALSSFATTWLTQHRQEATQRRDRESGRREHLFGDFIDEASRLMGEAALTSKLEDPSKLARLYALTNKLRLFASEEVLASSDKVMNSVLVTFQSPPVSWEVQSTARPRDFDILQEFAQSCRKDLQQF